MHRWSEEYRAFAVETFFKNNGSAIVTQRVFRRHFDIGRSGKVPTRQTILNWVTQFRTTASIVNKKPSGRPRTARTPENVRRVSHAFQHSPQRSARRHSVALHLSPRTVRRILHEDLKFHPSHKTATEGVHPRGNSRDSSKFAEESRGRCKRFRDVR
jgi:transposase